MPSDLDFTSPAQAGPCKAGPGPHSDARFRELFEQAPVSLQILAPDGRTVRVNRAWCALWQIHAGSELLAWILSGAYNVLTDAQLQEKGVTPYLRRAFDGESVEIPAIRYDTAELGDNGHARWVTARAHPLKDDAGRVVEVMLMHEDITGRVESEAALREREERFRSLTEATSQIIWTTDARGQATSAAASWETFTGRDSGGWRADGWLDALHPDDRAPTARLWDQAIRTRTVFETRYRIRAADGLYRWMSVKGVPVYGPDGDVREWIGANTDIHAMVTAQDELARRLARERRHSALLVKVADASRTLHAALSVQDIAHALAAEVLGILQVRHAAVTLHGAAPVAAGDPEAGQSVLSIPIVGRAGNELGVIEAAGKPGGAFDAEDEAVLVQLASIAAIGFENARLYAALKEQDRRKDEFLAMLAHELRNPLAPISAAAQVLRRTANDPDKVRQCSDIIARQASHMAVLMNDLLDVSRVTRGMVQLENAPVNMNAVVTSAAEQAHPLVEARQHALHVELDAPRVMVSGDRARLVQIVANLLTNAAKYTPPGGRIDLSVKAKDGEVAIAVADNGSGIEPALLPHVFELFTQGQRTPDRAQGGLGLGLALVKSMVGLHGGRVHAHSDGLNRGSVFTVCLPLLETSGDGVSTACGDRHDMSATS